MREILKDTAASVMVFMADSADHVTGKTGLTLTVTLSKDAGVFAAPSSGAVTERSNGWYKVALDATDTNTAGDLIVRATATGADPGERVAVIYETKAADTLKWLGTALPTPDTAGYPKVTIKDGTGQGELDITAGVVAASATVTGTVDARLVDGVVHGGTGASLVVKKLTLNNAGNDYSLQIGGSGAGSFPAIGIQAKDSASAINISGAVGGTPNQPMITLNNTGNAHPAIGVFGGSNGTAVQYDGDIAVTNGALVANIEGNVTGNLMGYVDGNLTGKVLGGGAGVITGTGARVVDASGNNVAPAATALDNTVWTNTKAGYLDMAIGDVPTVGEIRAELDANPVSVSDVTGNVAGSVASVVGNVGGNVTGSVGSVVGAVGSVIGAVGSVTGAVGSVTAAVTVGTNNDKTGYALVAGYDLAKTAAQAGDAMTLTAAYDAAKTASTQASVDLIAADVVNIETIVELLKKYRIGKHYLEVVGAETFEVVTYGAAEIIRKKVKTIGGTQVTIGANSLAISEESSV